MIDYDYEWKLLLDRLFLNAVAFFMPELYDQIDLNVPPIFLDKEFQSLIAERIKDKSKTVDKLARVQLKDGTEKWILIHFEVQSYFEKDFAKRVYQYYHLISEKYGDIDLTTYVVYAGSKIPKQYDEYKRSYFGTELSFKFNSYKIRDQKEEDLLASDNPFALAVLANWYIIKTKKNFNQRFTYKRNLVTLARARNLNWLEIQALFRFIRYIIELPEALALKFDEEVSRTLQKAVMTIPTEQDRKFARNVFKAVFGDDPEVYYGRFWERKREQERQLAQQERDKLIEQERQLAQQERDKLIEQERQLAQQERDKLIEQQRQLSQQERQSAQQERANSERQLRLSIIKKLLNLNTFTPEQIVQLVDATSLEEVLLVKTEIDN